MNSLYFSIGVAIILALVVALVGPLFVDWTAYRASFEERASVILGQPVRVAGTADMRLLPIPTLDFTDVVIGPDAANPLMRVSRFELEIELFPLLSGEVKVTNMHLTAPAARVRVGDDGSLPWIAGRTDDPSLDPTRITLDNVEIEGGSITILDDRRPAPLEITGVNARLDARSLIGPYRFDGSMIVEGEPVTVRASTGTREPSGDIVVKAAMIPASRPVSITLDGRLSSARAVPQWSGKAVIERVVAEDDKETLPWSLDAVVDLTPARLLAKDLTFRYGPEDKAYAITGATTVDLADPPVFEAVLSARQIDLDRTLGAGPDSPVSFQAVLAALSDTLVTLPRPPIEGRVGFDIPGIVVGGGIVTDLRLDLSVAETGWTVETLEANLPGKTTVIANGDLVTVGPLGFNGNAALQSDQPATLLSWWYPDRPKTGLDAFSLRARVFADAKGLSLTRLEAGQRGAKIKGEASFQPGGAGRKARVSLDLDADRLDADQVQAIAGLVGGEGGPIGPDGADVEFRVAARELRAGDAAAAGVDVAASLKGGTLAIEKLAVADLAGASLSAAGTIRDIASTPDGAIKAQLAAESMAGVARLVESVLPGTEFARLVRTAGPVLGPAALEASVTARASGDRTNATVSLVGSTAGTLVTSSLTFDGRVDRWRDAAVDLEARLEGPDGLRLMRQLGIAVPESDAAGIGRLQVSLKGTPSEALETTVTGELGPTRLSIGGTAKTEAEGRLAADLKVSLASPDVGPILALSGNPVADLLAATPVDLAADVVVDGPKVRLGSLFGWVSEAPLNGDLALDFSPAVPAVSGALTLRDVAFTSLGELALGPGTLAAPIVDSRDPWPEAPFGAAALDGLDTDVALSIGRVDLGDGLALDDASLSLRTSASGVGFDGISGRLAGGRLSGSVVVKRDLEGTAAVTGTLKLDGADAGALVWRAGDQPVVTGTASFDVEANATGRTVAGLVASASGGGSFAVADGRIRSFNPNAFPSVIAASDAGQDLPDEKIAALFESAVDAGDLPFARLEGTFTLAGGILRAPSIQATGGQAAVTGTATVDLPKHTLSSDWTITADAVERSAGSPPPQAGILFRGDLSAPTRRIDVAAFSNFLGIRSFERETERVLVMQADINERELLARSILREREDAERRARAAEEARLKAEEEARIKAEQEAARRLAEEAAAAEAARAEQEKRATERRPAAGRQPDGFTDEIEQRLKQLQPATDDGSLPGVRVPPPPGGSPPPG